ncbi:MAG: Haloalkane dehalogenase [Candidatus Heimdallarchaeota archaeon LC_2]|nr:MAG: Haloalkane dehalogenase [Candidatus Heimdallarchaeota archaeon LC_2]
MSSKEKKNTRTIIEEWSAKGQELDVPGTSSTRIWREGTGPTVLCLHGVPTSAYLYRKILPELANNGLEGVVMDFPGLGFSERQKNLITLGRDYQLGWRRL